VAARKDYFGCPRELFWLSWGIVLVGQGNSRGVELKQFRTLPDVHFLFLPLLPIPPPKHKYNAVSAVADEVWQYRMGGNLMIFNKNHDTAEEVCQQQSSCSQACGFATITMYSWWQSSEIEWYLWFG